MRGAGASAGHYFCYDQYPAFIGLVPPIAALFYAGMVVTVASWQEMVGLQEEKKKYFVEQQL